MNTRLLASAALVATLAASCAAHKIPGTDIDDTDESRALLALMDRYRTAVEARDSQAIVRLIAPDFQDDGGTPQADDDLDAKNLPGTLAQRFARIENVRLDLDVREVAVEKDNANAVYFYTLRYEMPGLNEKTQSAAELKRMVFRRVDGEWRILSGI